MQATNTQDFHLYYQEYYNNELCCSEFHMSALSMGFVEFNAFLIMHGNSLKFLMLLSGHLDLVKLTIELPH